MNTSMKSRSAPALLAVAAALALVAACSTTAEPNRTLDRAHADYRALQADQQAMLLSPTEMSQASEALRTADAAWTQSARSPNVEHLAYLARQRVAIARETTATRTWEKATTTAKAGSVADKARSDVTAAREKTQQKSDQLAVAQAGAQQDRARSTDLEMQLKDLNAKQTDRGDIVSLGDLLFDTNRSEMLGAGQRDLSRLAAFFKMHPKRTALIEGFTDSQGDREANVGLSQRRALSVRDALVEQGVPADRLSARGYGDAYPVASNATSSGRQMNRRVEIVLSRDDGRVQER
ncbi:OmpA family protein [Ideonella sp. YS5]|uniref:OmpA family protein n=1 Tax=Ideonella sp. YS5 TaxID=3453714 RepID=UPI003EED73C3